VKTGQDFYSGSHHENRRVSQRAHALSPDQPIGGRWQTDGYHKMVIPYVKTDPLVLTEIRIRGDAA
jgi:hypothetical protein